MITQQVVDAIAAIQENDALQPLVFVVPVSKEALSFSGRSATEVEDLCQGALEHALKDALVPVNAA